MSIADGTKYSDLHGLRKAGYASWGADRQKKQAMRRKKM